MSEKIFKNWQVTIVTYKVAPMLIERRSRYLCSAHILQ